MPPIPTNIITGFLGVGKTTAILHLLANKPADERWAVLVNEFGEVGIDGAMLNDGNTHVREVTGGCMCCVAGLPTKVALNMLLARAKPQRLLIEPTGLGHPQEIIAMLTGEYYRDILDLRAMIALVDPENIGKPRYLDNENFRDQIALADVLVANKTDRSEAVSRTDFESWALGLQPPKAALGWVAHGQLEQAWLDLPRTQRAAAHPHHHSHKESLPAQTLVLPPGEQMLRRENRGQEHVSCGWMFAPDLRFDFQRLFCLFSGVSALRLKAVIRTERGAHSFNAESGLLTVRELNEAVDSRVEIISEVAMDWDGIECELLASLAVDDESASNNRRPA